MPNALEYVITGALLKCSQGTVPMPFMATPRTTKIAGLLVGNALDKAPLLNIPSFVICQKLTQMAGGTPTPCVPQPTKWQDTYPARVGGAEALLFRSCITCPLGQGKIEFMTSGQLPLPPDVSQQIKETQEEADEALRQAELERDSVGEAGLAEGLIPIWGSGRDFIHAAQTGDKVGMALNGAFLVWDVVSVAAGVFSFGTATAAMMAGKAGVRTALKAGGKVALGLAKKKMLGVATSAATLKNGLKSLKGFGKKAVQECVTACFAAGTPVAMADDYKNIEDIRVGDLVWAWEQDRQNLALKAVTAISQREAHALVELHVGNEVLHTTPEHPFLLATNEWQQAGRLEVGDELLRSDRVGLPVRAVVHRTDQTQMVYNLEVADWHTYLVGDWLLVVHNGPCDEIAELLKEAAEAAKKQGADKVGIVLDEAVHVRNKGPFDISKFADEGAGSAKKLGDNMEKAMGVKRPKGHASHHMVMKKPRKAWTKDPEARRAVTNSQNLLKKHGIGIDNANNGVFLPHSTKAMDAAKRVANKHGPIHTKKYAKDVWSRLKEADKAGGKDEVLKELENLRSEMEKGIFKGHL